MKALFSPDSRFMRIMGRVADLIVLNLIFLLTCVPIITIGAASTALYSICFRFGTQREDKLYRTYFRVFRDEFKQGTLLWLMILMCTVTAGLNTYLFYLMPGPIRWASVLFAILFVLALFIAAYAFPLLSQFDNNAAATFKNALVLSLAYLPRSVLMAVFNFFPFALLLLDFYGFLQMAFLWVVIYFALAAYVNTILIKKPFAPYLPEPANKEEDPL